MHQHDLGELSRDWNDLASLDALWAINSRRDKKFSKWTVDEFLRSGFDEIQMIMGDARRLGRPRSYETALDFGCGVGRLSRHLADHFKHVEGVDISERMVQLGREIHQNIPNLTFRVNSDPDLRSFPDASFDMVCSIIVLQHLPGLQVIERYISEFVRVLRPDGLIVFQLPTALPKVRFVLARRTPYLVLRRLGLPPSVLYFRFGLHPMHMTAMPTTSVTACIRQAGGVVLRVTPLANRNSLYYATR